MRNPLVLVCGLQKSGTSLLLRLMTREGPFTNPLRWEGKGFWGDDPPFSPTAFPTGELYQRAGGERGHELGPADATPEVVECLRERLADAVGSDGRPLVLKNPYSSVRVPWLREVFPQARIVAVLRRPLPNVFSLIKKHAENPYVTRGPEEGWWGVKPAGWRALADPDPVVQAARQWREVNRKLWADRDLVDRLVPYHELCADPGRWLADIESLALGEAAPARELPALAAQDEEHLLGGPLESANRAFKRTKRFELDPAERAGPRLDPFTDAQRAAVEQETTEVAELLRFSGAEET